MTRDTSSPGADPANASNSPSDYPLAYQRLLALERFKSGFLARTSHELRSPVNTIVSLHQLILEDLCEGPEEEKAFIGQSKDAALKMLSLFDQITAVSKLDIGREPPKLEAVDLSFLLPEVEMLTTLQAANQNVRYTVASPTDELEVHTDEKWLKTTLVSLLQDAICNTKILRLAVEKKEQTVDIVIECDRIASTLQTELDNITNIALPAEPTAAEPKPSRDTLLPTDSIQLSTGLILATAEITLPLINGTFTITPHPDSAERSCLKCSLPAA